MVLRPEELAVNEWRLNRRSLLRLFAVVGTPLALALVAGPMAIKAALWLFAVLMLYPLIKGWGHTTVAVAAMLFPAYLYLELERAPGWLGWIAAFAALLVGFYLRQRLRDVRRLRFERRWRLGKVPEELRRRMFS